MTQTLNYVAIITGLIGGLALFLYGMREMTDALKAVAGSRMKKLLQGLTHNRFTALFAGTVITAVIQSSSVTTVLLVGFITAGLMNFQQSIGVILGADIGTTITAQIIAFKITKYALILIAAGFFIEVLAKREKFKHYGIVLMGLGLIFFGMELMSEATQPLRTYQPFINIMTSMENPLIGILFGLGFTALIQSSSATTGIVIVLASQGFITLEAGIALIFGANIGTCVTAILAAIGKPREAIRAAAAHVIIKVLGVLLWIAFIPQMADLAKAISPSAPELSGTARLAAETPRQIANAHTLFNVINAVLFVGLIPLLTKLVYMIVPHRAKRKQAKIQPEFLDRYYLDHPDIALDRVKLELKILGTIVHQMVGQSFPLIFQGNKDRFYALQKRDEDVDNLHGEIIKFLGSLSLQELIEPQPREIAKYIEIANKFENIGDVVESQIVSDGIEKIDLNIQISDSTREVLQPLYEKINWASEQILLALIDSDLGPAKQITASKTEFNQLANLAKTHLARRLTVEAPKRLETFRIETNIIESFKQIHTYYRRIASILVRPEKLELNIA